MAASNSEVSESISAFAMSSSRFSGFCASPSIASATSSGETTSSANRIVAMVITPSIGRSAARFSLLRSTNRATATLCASLIALTSSA